MTNNDDARLDLFGILTRHPKAAPVLLEAIDEGKIHGNKWLASDYWDDDAGMWVRGACGCVIGWVAASEGYESLGYGQFFDDIQVGYADYSPIEHFVWDIHPGDTPSTSPVLAQLREWIVEWQGGQE